MSDTIVAVDHDAGAVTVAADPGPAAPPIDAGKPVAVRYEYQGQTYYVTGSSGFAKAFPLSRAQKVQVEVVASKGNAELVQYDQVPAELRPVDG